MLAGAIVLHGATAPGQTVGISVFVDHFTADLHLSRSAVSTAYLVGTLSGALTMPAAGRLIDRRGVRTATLAALISTGLMFHHIDLLTGRGLTTAEAAATFLPLTLASAAGALAAGRYADRVSPRLLTAIGLVLLGISPALVQTIGNTLTAAVYGAVLGVAGAAIRTIEATALPRWFGIASIGQIRGVVMAAGVGASALGPLTSPSASTCSAPTLRCSTPWAWSRSPSRPPRSSSSHRRLRPGGWTPRSPGSASRQLRICRWRVAQTEDRLAEEPARARTRRRTGPAA